MKNDLVIMAELDWNGLHCQSHVMAKGFALDGHKVFYINRTLQRWPKLRHLMVRLRPAPDVGVTIGAKIPDNITVINLWVGPPFKWLRFLNSFLIKRKLKNYDIKSPILITYVPTYNFIDVARFLNPALISYVCYHNFNADVVINDLLKSEREIIASADILFADSEFLMNRLQKLSGGKVIYAAPPGVYFENFKKAFRGNEVNVLKKVCYFGGVGNHLDIAVYNSLCDFYDVYFIGVINPDVKSKIDKRIIVISPVQNDQLPALLVEMDVVTMLYVDSPYMKGVLPAKFFECIASGKPVLVSGLGEVIRFNQYYYDTRNDPKIAIQIIESLSSTHTLQKSEDQFLLAENSDFGKRYSNFKRILFEKLDTSNFTNKNSLK